MPYICYVYDRTGRVPYMEVLPEATLESAHRRASRLLQDRPDAMRAAIFLDETEVTELLRAPETATLAAE